MSFVDDFNLINSRPNEKNGENAFLFTTECYFLQRDITWFSFLIIALCKMRIKSGIYEQHPCNCFEGKDKYMSHDQLTAIFALSYSNKLGHHTEIWKEIKRQWFRYNNVEIPQTWKEKLVNKRFLHPRDIIFYGYCAGSWIWKLALPILWIFMLVSSAKTYKIRGDQKFIATDGKLLNFVRLQATRSTSYLWNLQWYINTWIIKRKFGSWNKVFNIYFPYDQHPCVIASKDI